MTDPNLEINIIQLLYKSVSSCAAAAFTHAVIIKKEQFNPIPEGGCVLTFRHLCLRIPQKKLFKIIPPGERSLKSLESNCSSQGLGLYLSQE